MFIIICQISITDSEGTTLVNLQVTINMEIVNNPPQFSNLTNIFYVSENAMDGTEVGTIIVTDESKSFFYYFYFYPMRASR